MLNRNKTKFDSPEFFVIRKKVFTYLKGMNDNYDLIFAALSAMSKCPLCIGSKVPGYIILFISDCI